MSQSIKKQISLLIIFILFLFIGYREFLVLYKTMLTEFIGYYKYQHIIIFYETGDRAFMDKLPMNVRFLGLFLQFLIFKLVPCNKFPVIEIKNNVHQFYECATFSLAFLNYFAKYFGLLLIIILIRFKLKKSDLECIVGIILYLLLINHLEASTMDRTSICYTLLILIFFKNVKIASPLLILSFLVNEKIIIIFGPVIFINYLFQRNSENLTLLISIIISLLLYPLMIYISVVVFDYDFFEYHGPVSKIDSILAHINLLILNPWNPKYITNAYLPILISFFPFLIYLITKKNFDHNFSIFYTIPLFLLIFLGYIGIENIGRYVMHAFPIWLPILASQITYFLNLNNEK